MRRLAAVLPFAWLAIGCASQPRALALDHVEATRWNGGTLEVSSARGIGGLTVEPAPARPLRICFGYDFSRPFGRLEGLEVVAVARGGQRSALGTTVDGACATVDAAPGAASLRVQFVDFYR
ncbi:MAG TPA: hypothetical protein PKN91_11360 [Steroidobacteraceae bacterium]|jgi:hypothetical protein|nr:hypothetical protein [Steroidobacteraceae bacterium]